MVSTDSLREALHILELPLNVSIADIRMQYKKLVLRYHPDRNPHIADDKIAELSSAYKMLIEYCEKYTISFETSDIPLNGEEWWVKRFGDNM